MCGCDFAVVRDSRAWVDMAEDMGNFSREFRLGFSNITMNILKNELDISS